MAALVRNRPKGTNYEKGYQVYLTERAFNRSLTH